MGSHRCTATVCDSVNLRMPSAPWRARSPDSFMPPIGESTEPHVAAYASLMLTLPVRIRSASRLPRPVSRVQMLALKPYRVALACSTTSASDEKR